MYGGTRGAIEGFVVRAFGGGKAEDGAIGSRDDGGGVRRIVEQLGCAAIDLGVEFFGEGVAVLRRNLSAAALRCAPFGEFVERLFDSEPGVVVVHGGLECAVLGQRLPGVEMISIGPEIVGPHAPGERVRISSTQRAYRLLGALLADLSR